MNTLGNNLRLTTFGESHGPAIGGIIDGFPAGFHIDPDAVQSALDARRPGASDLTSPRNEPDRIRILSGITTQGVTLGTPIGFIIENSDQHSADYESLRNLYRPNHADYTYEARYGVRDYRGGGRASARETANWVAAGAFAMQLLQPRGVAIEARLAAAGGFSDTDRMHNAIEEAREAGDSVGGVVECVINGIPAGLGNPVFDKLDARLAAAMMGINGVKGVEIGAGFSAAEMHGSEMADCFATDADGQIVTTTNFSGGIQGGISNGMPVTIRIAFKPTPSIARQLPTVDSARHPAVVETKGRHDPCIALRGVQVVKALAAFTVADFMLGAGFIPRHA